MSVQELPKPSEITGREKERAMAAYLTMFTTTAMGLPLPFLNFFAAWIYHHYIKQTSPFVSFHSYQSLIVQFVISLLNGILVAWVIYNLVTSTFQEMLSDMFYAFLIFVVILNLLYFIFSVVAAIKAYRGKMFYFYFFGKLAYLHGYRSYEENNESDVNEPPL